MKPIWAIQNNAVNQDQARAVAEAVIAAGGHVVEVSVHPMSDEIHFISLPEPTHINIIPYGSTDFVQMALRRGWTGVCHNANFSVPVWVDSHLVMLNPDSHHMMVSDLPAYLKSFDEYDFLFVRPQYDTKAFTGKVFYVEELLRAVAHGQLGRYPFPLDLPISVSSEKHILTETRWFIAGGRVIDGAVFRAYRGEQGYHVSYDEDIAHAQLLADIWLPHHTCVMDVVSTRDGDFVGEFNTVNSSGFYHHDIPKIIAAVNKSLT